jgi:hypothetical protein
MQHTDAGVEGRGAVYVCVLVRCSCLSLSLTPTDEQLRVIS